MPSVAVKLYSVYFKFMLNKRWQSRLQNPQPAAGGEDSGTAAASFGVTSRPREESVSPAKPNFTDGVATKDIHIDPLTSVAIRIFLPDSCRDPHPNKSRVRDNNNGEGSDPGQVLLRRNSYDPVNEMMNPTRFDGARNQNRRNSYACSSDDTNLKSENGVYGGYNPASTGSRKLPVMLQFHGGGFVSGSNDSVANDLFCRRIAKVCDVIVLSVGYRLAPENRFPAAFDDGLKVLHWLAKQANLAECSKSLGSARGGGPDVRKTDIHRHIADAFGASMVEPWLAAHADPSRCVLLGVSCGGNIADYVSRKAVEAGKLLDPVNVVAQVLMYPFFIGSVPTHSEIRLANSYFYDKATCLIAWKLFLPEDEFNLDHPAANPLIPNRGPPLKKMPPTLTIVAEHDWMRDRAIAYSQELRKVNVDAPVYEYKDAVHEFATLGILLGSPQAQACAEDISIWVKKYISLRGHEFSY